jgi:hypothetical protein
MILRAQEASSDLRWFWREAAGEMGLRSNFESVRLRLQGVYGNRTGAVEMDHRALGAASRVRAIHRRLERVPDDQVRTLFAAYGLVVFPGLLPWGRCAGVLPLQPLSQQAHHRSRTKRSIEDWLSRLHRNARKSGASSPERELAGELQRDAESALIRAENMYLFAEAQDE